MSNKEPHGKGSQNQRTLYKSSNRFIANRKARLERTLKKQPNNEQVKLALKDNVSYKRKAPTTPYWSHTMIKEAKIIKEVTGSMSLDIFSNIEKTNANARLHLCRKDYSQIKLPEGKVSFTLGARAHDNRGNLVWG